CSVDRLAERGCRGAHRPRRPARHGGEPRGGRRIDREHLRRPQPAETEGSRRRAGAHSPSTTPFRSRRCLGGPVGWSRGCAQAQSTASWSSSATWTRGGRPTTEGRPAAGSASMWPTSGVGVGAFGAQLQAGVGVDHRAVAQRLGELELVRPERCGVAAGRGVLPKTGGGLAAHTFCWLFVLGGNMATALTAVHGTGAG